MKTLKRTGPALLTLLFALVFLAIPVSAHIDVFEQFGIAKPRRVKSAPAFTLNDLKGNAVSFSKFRGKTVLLNFWATWCEACKEELPSMQRMHEALSKKGIQIVAVSIDRGNADRVQEYVDKYKLTFPVLLDPDQQIRKSYFIMGLPTSYLIDPEGKLRGFISGSRQWDDPNLMAVFSSLVHPTP